MKGVINLVGILLIIFGLGILGYQGFTYTKREQVAKIGSLQITSDTQKTVYFPPILGGASLIAGILLIVVGRKRD